jgi:hypothetical protein
MISLGCLVAAILGACAAGSSPAERPAGNAARLFAERRYFELNRLLAAQAGNVQTDMLFYRGMMASAFNRPEASVEYLNAYLKKAEATAPKARLREVFSALADDYTKLFEYGRVAEARQKVFALMKNELDAPAVADFERVIAFWNALKAYSPQTVRIPESTEIPAVGRMEVMANLGTLEVALMPDTGSSLSLIIRADAERLGFQILDAPVQVGTATGEGVLARPAVVPELRIGAVTIRNAVFLVVPERMLYFPEIKRQRSGTLGFPILNALKEITFTRGGIIDIPARPSLEGEPNFFLDQTKPILRAAYEGHRLLFLLDTGGFSSELYPPFFSAFRKEIIKRGIPAVAVIEGVGTQVKVPTYLMRGLSFFVAGRMVDFKRDFVILTKPTSEGSDIYDGSFGIDLLSLFNRMTINYESMRFALD